MSDQLVYFISGANRGIGLALVNEIATRDSTAVVYAGARDPSGAPALQELASKFAGRVAVVKYVAGDTNLTNAIADLLRERHGRVDVVIGNAAIQPSTAHAAITPIADVRDMFEVNTIGVLVLFQIFSPLLKASPVAKFIPITSSGGSLTYGIEEDLGLTGYGASKAALNYISRRIHFENEWITCFPIAPGVVDTDMLVNLWKRDPTGTLEKVAQQIQKSPSEAAKQLANVIEKAKRDSHGGEFLNFDGTKLPW